MIQTLSKLSARNVQAISFGATYHKKSEENKIFKDFSGLSAMCGDLVTVNDIEELSLILARANQGRYSLVPIGGRTGTGGGYSGNVDIGLDYRKINFTHENPDHSVTVGAGTKVCDFMKFLKNLDMVVPMTEAPQATIGGSIALDNPSKPYADSGLERYLKSITVVEPSGKIKKLNKYGKNHKLFNLTIGGEGITGVIAEATFCPTKLSYMKKINIKFNPYDYGMLEQLWNQITIQKTKCRCLSRGVVYPLGILQVRLLSDTPDTTTLYHLEKYLHKIPSVKMYEGEIPIGEALIRQISKHLGTTYRFFPAISNISYNDRKLARYFMIDFRLNLSQVLYVFNF